MNIEATTVAELLDCPERWIQGASAADSQGAGVLAHDPRATCWCLSAAIRKVYGDETLLRAEMMKRVRLFISDNWANIVEFNDAPGRTFEEIRAVVLEAGI